MLAGMTIPDPPRVATSRNRPGAPGFGVVAGLGADILEPLAREVVRLGYGSFWANDGGRPGADGLADLAVVHSVAPDLPLGVGVLPLDVRTPDAIADEVHRLELPVDRLWLGVGSGGGTKPIGIVRAGIGELRRHLPEARILVGALGPQMLRLAGELADGVLLNWTVPSRIPWAREQLDEGVGTAGRDPRAIEVWAYVRCAVGPDARARIGGEAARYSKTPQYGRAIEALGVPLESIGMAATDPTGDGLAPQIESYRAALDGLVIRALPAGPTLADLVAIARAAALHG